MIWWIEKNICLWSVYTVWYHTRFARTQTRVQLRLYLRNYCVRYIGTDAVCTRLNVAYDTLYVAYDTP